MPISPNNLYLLLARIPNSCYEILMDWEVIFKRNISWSDLEILQRELIHKVHLHKTQKFLLISEPTPTFTYGRNSIPQDLLWPQDVIERHHIKVASVSRGGKWTYHGPGQILIYPIVHLPSLGYSSKQVRAFLEDFRTGVCSGLEELGCNKLKMGEPFGIYIDDKKLASFGLAFERGISSHGVALYVTDQSRYFNGINPCGVSDSLPTCLEEDLGHQTSWNSVATLLAQRIKKRLSLRISRVL